MDQFNRVTDLFVRELRRLGLTTSKLRKQEPDADSCWSIVANWLPQQPRISIWYGRWFPERPENRFWFGFQGSKDQVITLRQTVEESGIFSRPPLDYIIGDPTWNFAAAAVNDGFTCEYGDARDYYIGIYDTITAAQGSLGEIALLGARFIDKVISIAEFAMEIDVNAVRDNKDISGTERAALILARRGQGQFRRKLERIWRGRCAVTGCQIPEGLRASHIKPWQEAENDERLDPDNGLLLSATLDALFDKALISFNDEGLMIIGPELSPDDRALLQLDGMRLSSPPTVGQCKYLTAHRERMTQIE